MAVEEQEREGRLAEEKGLASLFHKRHLLPRRDENDA
jgi:hypothetical protein